MTDFVSFFPADFHFLRPEWFYALLPLALIWWVIYRWRRTATGWQGVIASHLYQHLVSGPQPRRHHAVVGWLATAWALIVVALAGPTWERIPQPVYQLKAGHVIVMDMSMSMRATDITPDRLSRAKYKAIDLVKLINEGDMGLVAYAGDAFVISPLTQDVNTLTSLLPSLSPEIMPVNGSEPILGLRAAASLLENAGFQRGTLYWITDGVELDQMKEISDFLSNTRFRVNILGVGTAAGAPIKQLNGELLKRANGAIVIPKMNSDALQRLSRQAGGEYAQITTGDGDIRRITATSRFTESETRNQEQDTQGDEWAEAGPYLLLLLLPLAALSFRRGVVFAIGFCLLMPLTPEVALAQAISAQPNATSQPEHATSDSVSWWQKPFLNADQTGYEQFKAEQYDQASASFDNPAWKGAAQYRAGDYENAANTFGQLGTANGFFNQGNALAKAGRLDDAIAAYEQALAKQPEFPQAADNKALVEQLKSQQEQQQSQNDKQNQSDDQQNKQDQNEDQQGGDSQQQNSDGDNQQQSEANQSDSNPQNQQPSQSDQQSESNDEQHAEQRTEDADDQGDSGSQQPPPPASESQQQPNDDKQMKQAIQGDTERDKETEQRLNNLLRRVPDDPAFLLKRKMQLEAQKRQYRRPPSSDRSDW